MAKKNIPRFFKKNFKITKIKLLIFCILLFGLIYRIILTWNGNFIFHIDSARDMLDVRDMVVLHHWRLIGPTTGIDGLFLGPGWYYLLAVPFVLSKGNPFAAVLMMDLFWLIGGYFLLKMVSNLGIWSILAVGFLWIASNYIVLDSMYSFSPNPITFLTPFFIYALVKYLDNANFKYALLVGLISALFWNLEMAFALYLPFIILSSILLSKKYYYLVCRPFWIGLILPFLLGFFPQLFFEIRHNFFMMRNVLSYLSEHKSTSSTFNLFGRVQKSWNTLAEGFRGTLMNQPILIWLGVLLLLVLAYLLLTKKYKFNTLVLVGLLVAITPFIGFSLLPLVIQIWHIGASLVAIILLIGIAIGSLERSNKKIAMIVTALVVVLSIVNLNLFQNLDFNRPIDDPSEFRNQIAAIDFAYQEAHNKNFKTYVYSPGILDLSYQYNFWWYGQNTKYGYLPEDFAYLPNQPEYIKYKNQFFNGLNPTDSGLVILIKEPGYPEREDLWKNSFSNLPLLKTKQLGPLSLEVRKKL